MDRADLPGVREPSLGPGEDEAELQLFYERWLTSPVGAETHIPHEVVEWELAEHMGWTWMESQATPYVIRRRWGGFLMTKRTAAGKATPSTPASKDAARANAAREIAKAEAEVAALDGEG